MSGNVFLALLRAEWLLLRQGGRSRLALLLYPLLTLAPSFFFTNLLDPSLLAGPATPLRLVAAFEPLTALLLAAGLAGRGADRASREELLPLLTSSPFSSGLLVCGRAAALALAFLFATAIPYLTLALLSLARGEAIDPLALAGAWLLRAWPMATVMGWTWLALALLGGSDLAALLLLVFGGMLLGNLAQIGKGWDTSFNWPFLQFPSFYQQAAGLLLRGGETRLRMSLGLIASEGPYDLRLAATTSVVDFLPAAGLALFLLCFAALRLGRCRADLAPRDFSWAPSLGRLRQALAGDGRLGFEKWAVWLALVPAFLALLVVERRSDAYFAWGQSRAEAEEPHPEDLPTDPALTLLRLRLEADLGQAALLPDGRLEGRFEEDFLVRGEQASSHLSFALNPFLELRELKASAGGRQRDFELRRRYNRLFVRLEEPLLPGEELHLAGRIAGRPARPHIGLLPRYGTDFFGETWTQILRDPAGRRHMRLAATKARPSISRNQVRLVGEDLLPIPRYHSWQPLEVGQPDPFANDRAEADPIPAESRLEAVPIELEIRAPRAWQLFSSCAQQAEIEGERLVLRGTCEGRPAEFTLRGGQLEVASRGEVKLATLASHAAAAQPLLDTLAEVHRQSERAWPGALRLGSFVLIERAPYFGEESAFFGFQPTLPILASGNLLEIAEQRLIAPPDLDPFELVGPLLVDRLLRDRPIAAQEAWAINAFLRAVVTRRLGLHSGSAVLSGPVWEKLELAQPVSAFEGFLLRKGARRLAALVADLEGRVGNATILAGLEDFLAERQSPGRLTDLIEAIDRHSEESLDRFAQDFLLGGALPELQLAEVSSSPRQGGGFQVSGLLRNSAKGEVLCPLVLRTERGELWQKVRVGDGADAPFTFDSPQKPLSLELDPAGTCLRYVAGTSTAGTQVTL